MGTTISICITIIILGIVFMILFFRLMDKKITLDYNNKVELANLEKKKFYSSIDRNKLILEIEEFVNTAIEEYCILYINNTEEPYITEKMQDEIVEQVMVRLPDKLSPVLVAKIKLCMNIKESKDMYNYLKYTVSLGVMKKVLETNRLEPDDMINVNREADSLLGTMISDYDLKSNF